MVSLFSTWQGLIKYQNPKMPIVHSVATFVQADTNSFTGTANETALILPDDFREAYDVNGQYRIMPWGSIDGRIFWGEVTDRMHEKWGRFLNFVKSPDQLTGYPVFYSGAFSAAAEKIVGTWKVVEGDTPCHLPLHMKSGFFTFTKPNGGRSVSPPAVAPVTPELLLV